MGYRLASPKCSTMLDDLTTPWFPIELDLPGEQLVGVTSVTEECDKPHTNPSRHVMVTGWLVVSTRTLSWLDNDGICYRQRVLHPTLVRVTR